MKQYLISPMKKGFPVEYAQIGIKNHCSIIIDQKTFESELIQKYIKSNFIKYEIREVEDKSQTVSAKTKKKKSSNQSMNIKKDEEKNSGIAESKETSDVDKVDATTKSNKKKRKD